MFNEYQFSYSLESGEITMTLGGTDLTISEDETLLDGYLETVQLSADWDALYEENGLTDGIIFESVLNPIDVSNDFETSPDADFMYLFGVLAWANGLNELGADASNGFVAIFEHGDDLLLGSSKAEHYTVGGDGREINMKGGDDFVRIQDNAGPMTLKMGSGDDTAYGNDGNDTMYGGSGHDYLAGEAGDDQLFGQSGDDTLYGGLGDDTLKGGSGEDYLHGGDGNNLLLGQGGDDQLFSDSNGNLLKGHAGDDVLFVAGDGDRLFGGSGNDVLAAHGTDTVMNGGAGSDAFVFLIGGHEQASESRFVIQDFQQGDDFLWFSPHGNDTHSAQDAFDLFTQFGHQVGNNVVVRDGDWKLVIKNADLADFSVEDFVDGSANGGIYQWSDTVA